MQITSSENIAKRYEIVNENQSKLIPSPLLLPIINVDLKENLKVKKYFNFFFVSPEYSSVSLYLTLVSLLGEFWTRKQGVSHTPPLLFFCKSFCRPTSHLKLASRQDMKNTYYGRCSLKLKSLFLIVSKLFWKRGFFFCLGLR